MTIKSLNVRLVATSGILIGATLFIAAFVLDTMFHAHIEERFDAELVEHLAELIEASKLTPSGELDLDWTPYDPRFKRPLSGWYWEVLQDDRVIKKSTSAKYLKIPVTSPGVGSVSRIEEFTGPENERLRGIVEDVMLPGGHVHFTYLVSGPVSHIERSVRAFTKTIAITLIVLGIGLMGAVLLQVIVGLRPLRTLQLSLGRLRKGLATRLPETFPSEVQPLVSELNALLDHNAAFVERARIQASNLTHALKNPLTVIRNEADEVPGEQGRVLRDQAERMKNAIDRFRFHAHTAATVQVLGARSSVADVVEELCFSMDLLHKDRHLVIRRSGLDSLYFRGDEQDLEEILGNLIDNACKWARKEVAIAGQSLSGWFRITVEEDGPGIPEQLLPHALERGKRLDESVTGTGLGFDIVLDIAEVYRGALSLEKSSLGGLKATLELPAAN